METELRLNPRAAELCPRRSRARPEYESSLYRCGRRAGRAERCPKKRFCTANLAVAYARLGRTG